MRRVQPPSHVRVLRTGSIPGLRAAGASSISLGSRAQRPGALARRSAVSLSTSIHWAAGTRRWEGSHEARQPVETSHAASPWPRVMNEIHFAPPFRPDDPSPINTNNGFLPMVSRIGFRPHLGSTRQNTLEMLEMSYPVHNVWHHPKSYRPPKALQVSLLAVGGRARLRVLHDPLVV